MIQANPIQWFPGHMAKTRRMIAESLPDVDVVLELLDARIPHSSKNPEIKRLLGAKPTVTVLNKASLADRQTSLAWRDFYKQHVNACVILDSITGEGLGDLRAAVNAVLADKIARYREKGMENRRLKAMIVGIPNVGKSSLINRLAGGKHAKVEDRPGVTVNRQWVSTDIGLSLLDMPGVLWPKFDEKEVGENLAVTGAIRDRILDVEEIAMILCTRLMKVAPDLFTERYRLDRDEAADLDGYDLLESVGRRRGFLVSGGEVNLRRTAEMLLDEFRGAKIGRISLETPPREKENSHA